jgi:hypothetical protein
MKIFTWFFVHGIQLVVCSSASVMKAITACNGTELSVISDNGRKTIEKFIKSSSETDYFHSHRIPLNTDPSGGVCHRYHAANPNLIQSMAEASTSAFHRSMTTTPIIMYERPGHAYMNDELHEICAEFRATKNSVSPSAYSKQEKFQFLAKIINLGVFTDIEGVAASPVKAGDKQKLENREKVVLRGMFSASIMSSHFCRDALRLIASILDSRQVAWLLEYSIESIAFNPELLDQLEDYSMFSSYHVVTAFNVGNYDWFNNPRALSTFKASALIGLFAKLNYNLSPEQLEILNYARPIENLFKEREFLENPFVWQVTAGSPYYRDEHMNMEALARAIRNFEEEVMPEELKSAIFSLYVHSEAGIMRHIEELLKLIKADGTTINNDYTRFYNYDTTIYNYETTIYNYDSVINNESLEDVQCKLAEFHFRGLNFIFTHRQIILAALIKSDKDQKLTRKGQLLMELFVTPSFYPVRSAMKLVEEMKRELVKEGKVEIRDFIKLLNSPSTHSTFSKGIALILAFCELAFDPIKLPYRQIRNEYIRSTSEHIENFRMILSSQNFLDDTRWPKIFLIHQIIDFKACLPFHNSSDDEIIDQVLTGFLICSDLKNYSEFEINLLLNHFPESCQNLMEAIEDKNSIEAKFQLFKTKFLFHTKKYREFKQNIEGVDTVLHFLNSATAVECQLMALIQNCFKPEMSNLLMKDHGFLTELSEFSHLLKRSQVAELLRDQEGRRLLSESRQFLHNLSTFEDFKASDINSLKLQPQYATMVRTLPLIPLLNSFKNDEFIFNDPLALSWRLFGNLEHESDELLSNIWRIVPFQMLAENWQTELKRVDNICLYNVGIKFYLKNNREVNGKPLEALKQILHWAILQEIKFLESFLLINTRESLKWKDAFNAAIFASHPEHADRDFISNTWVNSISNHPEIKSKLRPNFFNDLYDIINSPLSQLRGGVFLASRNIMDKNLYMINFGEYFVGFDSWTREMMRKVNLPPKSIDLSKLPAESETYSLTKDKIIRDRDNQVRILKKRDDDDSKEDDADKEESSRIKYVFTNNSDNSSHTNIPQYREQVEQDVRTRQQLLLQMLSELDSAIGENSSAHSQLWSERIKLLGMFSADGFTLRPDFNLEDPFMNLPLHELILYRKLRKFSNVDETNLPEDMKPEYLATTIIIQSFKKVEEVPSMTDDDDDVDDDDDDDKKATKAKKAKKTKKVQNIIK